MTELKTADQWWAEYAAIKEEGIKVFASDLPVARILSQRELATRLLGKTSVAVYDEHPDKMVHEVWDILETNKDVRMWNILQGIWNDAPDSKAIHSWPHWHQFCDLCSEGPEALGLVPKTNPDDGED